MADNFIEKMIEKIISSGQTGADQAALSVLHPNIGQYIRVKFGLSTGNKALMTSCRFLAEKYAVHNDLNEDDASALIIKELWNRLKETHSIRLTGTTPKEE